MNREKVVFIGVNNSGENPVNLVSEKKFSTKIKAEFKEANGNFKDLIEMVLERYKNMPESVQKDLISHNEEILQNVIELALKKNFSREELKTLEIAAILHDIAKADAAPEEFKDIKNYPLILHGEKAAEESKKILTDEYLSKHGFLGDFENVRGNVFKAILEHMGPHPGFMSDELEKVNGKLKEMGKETIKHPQAQGKISEMLLAADMASLASEKGRKKVLSLREIVPSFIQDDLETVEKYKHCKIRLKQGEAALISGFRSAFQARNMIKDEEIGKWIEKIIEKSLKAEYYFKGERVHIGAAFAKLKIFNETLKEEEQVGIMREQIRQKGIQYKASNI